MQAKNDWRYQVRTGLYYSLVPGIGSSYVVSEIVSSQGKLAITGSIRFRAGQMCRELQRALGIGAAQNGKGEERKKLRLHNPVQIEVSILLQQQQQATLRLSNHFSEPLINANQR